MTQGFWSKLEKPIFCLAPMADVTDPAFRYIIAKYSKFGGADIGEYENFVSPNPPVGGSGVPYVTWTEFVSCDGLFLGGKEALMKDLKFSEVERPIVAQFFTAKPELMKKAAKLAVELGFDGVDINMGCPDRSIEKQGAGAALIKNPKLAREIIRAAKEGAESASASERTAIPVSVKTRVGYNKDEIDPPEGGWISELLKEEPVVLTIHARTRKEMSKVPADWNRVKRAVEIRDRLQSQTLIFGNGDVLDLEDGERRVMESGADGAMLGRAIFGNPWLFRDLPRGVSDDPRLKNEEITERLIVLVEHTKLFEQLLGEYKSFSIMKKHYKAYVNGWDGAKELRMKLMEAENSAEVEKIVSKYLSVNK